MLIKAMLALYYNIVIPSAAKELLAVCICVPLQFWFWKLNLQ